MYTGPAGHVQTICWVLQGRGTGSGRLAWTTACMLGMQSMCRDKTERWAHGVVVVVAI